LGSKAAVAFTVGFDEARGYGIVCAIFDIILWDIE
jgi:hypothetical protein